MTCEFHFAAIRAEWLNRGGDWLDTAGSPQGAVPFDEAAIRSSSQTQAVDWDIVTLANEWNAGKRPAGAILLAPVPGVGAGIVNFRSREFAERSVQPLLLLEWDDGLKQSLDATSDTTLNCTTRKSLGGRKTLKVGPHEKTVLIFPFERRPGYAIKTASLRLHSYKQWQGGTTVGAYRLFPPWAATSKRKPGLSSAYLDDKGIESDSRVLFATGFESENWQEEWSTFNPKSTAKLVRQDGANGFSALQGQSLEVVLTPSQNLALDIRYDFAEIEKHEPEELYFRYYLRFGQNWNPTRDGGKLPGFGGTYNQGGWGLRKATGENGWSIRGAFFQYPLNYTPIRGFAGIGSYAYHMDVSNAPSENWGWGLGPGGLLKKNQWYSIEQYVKLNTIGKKDGVFKAWIDGHLVAEKSDLRFRDTPEVKIENVWLNVYHGGVSKPPREMSLYIDNVVIAKDYIGPMAK
jgi:hypothetical protein